MKENDYKLSGTACSLVGNIYTHTTLSTCLLDQFLKSIQASRTSECRRIMCMKQDEVDSSLRSAAHPRSPSPEGLLNLCLLAAN